MAPVVGEGGLDQLVDQQQVGRADRPDPDFLGQRGVGVARTEVSTHPPEGAHPLEADREQPALGRRVAVQAADLEGRGRAVVSDGQCLRPREQDLPAPGGQPVRLLGREARIDVDVGERPAGRLVQQPGPGQDRTRRVHDDRLPLRVEPDVGLDVAQGDVRTAQHGDVAVGDQPEGRRGVVGRWLPGDPAPRRTGWEGRQERWRGEIRRGGVRSGHVNQPGGGGEGWATDYWGRMAG